jgi:cytochrome c oxidase subunit 3
MRAYAVYDAEDLPRFHPNKKEPLWWGILGLIAIELTVVTSLIVSYFYLSMLKSEWPPGGIEAPELLLPTVDLALLLLSAAAMYWANWATATGKSKQSIIGLAIAILLDATVLYLRWWQFQDLDFKWYEHAYGSIVWTLTGFHFLHVASAVVGTVVVEILAIMHYWNEKRRLGAQIDAMYWYFVSLIWVPIYLTLYWAPRVL